VSPVDKKEPACQPERDRTRAVILDMDGVITDTMPYHYLAWKTVLAEEGIYVSHFDIYKREGRKRK